MSRSLSSSLGRLVLTVIPLGFLTSPIPTVGWAQGFSSPAVLNLNAASDSEDDPDPRIAAGGTTWIVVWSSRSSLSGTIGSDADILMARSTDNGATWSVPRPLNPTASIDEVADIDPDIATDGAGNWVVAWQAQDWANQAASIMAAVSSDDGLTWSQHSTSLGIPNGFTVPRIEADRAGTWLMTWATGLGPGSDIYASRSTDNGRTWGPKVMIHSANGPDDWDGRPDIATDRLGTWMVVWIGRRDSVEMPPLVPGEPPRFVEPGYHYGLYAARSTDGGSTWEELAPSAIRVFQRDGIFVVREPWAAEVAADSCGNWVLAWSTHSKSGTGYKPDDSVFLSLSQDAGTFWETASELSLEPTHAFMPSIASDRRGNWHVLWFHSQAHDSKVAASFSAGDGRQWSSAYPVQSTDSLGAWGGRGPDLTATPSGHWVAAWTAYGQGTYAEGDIWSAGADTPEAALDCEVAMPAVELVCTPPFDFVPCLEPEPEGSIPGLPPPVRATLPQRCLPEPWCPECALSGYLAPTQRQSAAPYVHEAWLAALRSPEGMSLLAKRFEDLPTGATFTSELKNTLLRRIGTGIRRAGTACVVREAINAIELDRRSPAPVRKHIETGARVSTELEGMGRLTFHQVERAGQISLDVRNGWPGMPKGFLPSWPAASYHLEFSGELAPGGFVELEIYVGGSSLAPPGLPSLLEWDGERFRNITNGRDPTKRTIRGNTRQLGTYMLAQRYQPAAPSPPRSLWRRMLSGIWPGGN